MKLSRLLPPIVAEKAYLREVLLERSRGGLRAVRRNERLRGIHAGKRCFVIGNGPSLRKQDLTRLKTEHVLTVNTFVKHLPRYGLTPTAHALIDPWYFDGRDPKFEDLHAVAESAENSPTLWFFPVKFRAVVEGIIPESRRAKVHYLLFAGDLPKNRNTDICNALPGLQTVTLATLLIAIHMGYSQIYLLGCDMDWLSHVAGVSPLRIRDRNFYLDSESIIEVTEYDYGSYCAAIARMFDGFRHAGTALESGQKILNAGADGLLDLFERTSYEGLFR